MNEASRAFPELSKRLGHFSASTRRRLSRSLVRALRGRRHISRAPLDIAISEGCIELRASGLDDRAIMEFLGGLVEETGRACGADRPSLLSGELRWQPVHTHVLAVAAAALRGPSVSEEVLPSSLP